MRLRSWHMVALVAITIFGTIAATSLAGVWKTEGSRVPQRIRGGSFSGVYDPADIRGSYTLLDIEAAFGIPVDVLARAFGVSGDDASVFSAKDLEERYGDMGEFEIGTDSLRLFVALYLGLPYEPEDTTALPQSAYRVLSEDVTVDPTRLEDLDGRLAGPQGGTQGGLQSPAAVDDDHDTTARAGFVRGRTTFAELLDGGLTEAQIEEVIGGEMPARGALVRNYAVDNDKEFGALRTQLQVLLDALE